LIEKLLGIHEVTLSTLVATGIPGTTECRNMDAKTLPLEHLQDRHAVQPPVIDEEIRDAVAPHVRGHIARVRERDLENAVREVEGAALRAEVPELDVVRDALIEEIYA